MKAAFMIALTAAVLAAQQDKKPESAPTTRPHSVKVLGRAVSLSLPGDWIESEAASTFALQSWERGKSWKHPKIANCSLHLYGAEGPGLTPATLAKEWIGSAGAARIDLKVEVGGRSRQMRGLDVELELDENGAQSFYWMRAIGGAKDRVFVLLAEASPLDYDKLEAIVLAAGRIFDSFLDPAKKDPWKRDCDIKVTRGDLVTRLTVPAGWEYTRLAPEGSLIWMGPENQQEFILAFPQTSVRPGRSLGGFPGGDGPTPEQFFDLIVKGAEILRALGRLVSNETLPGLDRTAQVVVVNRGNSRLKHPPVWNWRRIILHGTTVVSLLAKQPVKDYDAPLAAPLQKQITTVLDSIRFEAAPKN